jgi:hypothetical protein
VKLTGEHRGDWAVASGRGRFNTVTPHSTSEGENTVNEKKVRATLDALISHYGVNVVFHGDDALGEMCNLIRGSDISREDLAALTAFAVRRLFNKSKFDLVKMSVN